MPGCVHTDLRRNGLISNPFYGTNERDLQWIDKKDWEYETVFDVPSQVLDHAHVNLVFEGLDTFAQVTLNGQLILSSNNMFRSYKIDVKSLLNPASNRLHVRFKSPIQETLPLLEQLGYPLPATNDVSEIGGVGDKKLSVFARKAPYHFGWDWGPRFVTSGIWKPAYLEAWSGQRITDVWIRQEDVTASMARVTVTVEMEADSACERTLSIEAAGVTKAQTVHLEEGVNVIQVPVEIENPKLWWSRGLGDATLTEFTATLANQSHAVAKKSVRTGLRRIRVVREGDDTQSSFYFELNGVPVFAKGANHIPNDSFVTDITYDRYQHEILSAVESNMNMLRVWGGGFYEFDMFYDLCDEHGILVWQDFMFACSMYPGDEAFLENVRLEAAENVRRLRNHPCIAIWCGNNEIDTAWSHYREHAGWGWKQNYTPEIREEMWKNYEQIFHHILPAAVTNNHPEIFYWPSSPLAQWTHDERQHADNQSPHGDIHYWGVWHAVEPFENYNVYVGRFMSEYGFQSFPELKTVQTYAEESDMALDSDVMLLHQKNGRGNFLIKQYMEMYYQEPKDFPAFLYMSQIQQAEAIKSAIEAHRRRKPYCMGTLYWQMNDCWPVASWSSMDYLGRWKALQYYARRSFRDVSVSIYETAGNIDVYVISDILTEVTGDLTLQLVDFQGNVLREETQSVTVPANGMDKPVSVAISDLLGHYAANSTLLLVTLRSAGSVIDAKEHYFTKAKEMALPIPTIRVKEVVGFGGTQFEITTDVLARNVWLSAEQEGIFDDNYFDLIPGVTKVVTFKARSAGADVFTPSQPGELTVSSMADYVRG